LCSERRSNFNKSLLCSLVSFEFILFDSYEDYITPDKPVKDIIAALYAIFVLHGIQKEKMSIFITPAASDRIVSIISNRAHLFLSLLFKLIAPHFSFTPFPVFLVTFDRGDGSG
jgi:hypothetical protein